jgi:hypothetical protein
MTYRLGWLGAFALAGLLAACGGANTDTTDATAESPTEDAASLRRSMSVTVSGDGSVTMNPGSLVCTASCSWKYSTYTTYTLTAAPKAGAVFAGWSGACTGTSTTCTPNFRLSRIITATFKADPQASSGSGTVAPPSTYALTVAAPANGAITSSPAGISCGGGATNCSASFAAGTSITLTATPASGYKFAGWGWTGCAATSTCAFTMPAAAVATTPTFAALTRQINVSWNPSADTTVTGYRLYHGTSSGVYAETFSASSASYLMDAPSVGTHYFAVTAITSGGVESARSSEISVVVQ